MSDPWYSVTRVIKATGYSMAGLRAAWRNEAAFRFEVILAAPLLPLAAWLGENGVQRALLIGSLVLVPVVEILNSAVEAVVDRVGMDHHPLAERAKDLGSAAVFLSLVDVVVVWALVLAG